MAIEDEIINISDIDVGTEILRNDKLIIETNSGTKLLSFKDLVIGEENISFGKKLVQGIGGQGATSTAFTTVTGFNILTSDTDPGHVTRYVDVSGTAELGVFNYNAISELGSVSAVTLQNEAEISQLKNDLAAVLSQLEDSNVTVTVGTSAVNFRVHNKGGNPISYTKGTKFYANFDTVSLNPTKTHTDGTVSFNEKPFSMQYPTTNFNSGYYLFTGTLRGQFMDKWARSFGLAVPRGFCDLYKNGSKIAAAIMQQTTSTGSTTHHKAAIFNHVEYITPGDKIYIKLNSGTGYQSGSLFGGSNFAGIRIG